MGTDRPRIIEVGHARHDNAYTRRRHWPAAGGRTQGPGGREDGRYYYYLDRIANAPPHSVFACDHAYDCESLARKATVSEVLALIGREAPRAAKEECAWYGLGSKRLLVYVTTERERRERPHRARGERAVGDS